MGRIKIALKFSDLEMGCDEFGFIDRRLGLESDEHEDIRYLDFLRDKVGDRNPWVRDGFLYLDKV